MLWDSGSLKSVICECWEKNMATLGGIINWNQHVLSPSKAGNMMFSLGGVDKLWWGNEPDFSGKPLGRNFSVALKCEIMFHT